MRGRQTYHQGKRKQRKPPLKKNGWVRQRFKPFPLELPSIFAEREKKTGKPEQHPSLTFDDLKKIRDKASKWTKNFNLRSKISEVNNSLCCESLVESSQPEPVFFSFALFRRAWVERDERGCAWGKDDSYFALSSRLPPAYLRSSANEKNKRLVPRGKRDDAEVKALASNHRDLGSFPEPAIYFCNPLTLRGD